MTLQVTGTNRTIIMISEGHYSKISVVYFVHKFVCYWNMILYQHNTMGFYCVNLINC